MLNVKVTTGTNTHLWLILFLVCGGILKLSADTNLSVWMFPGPSGRVLAQPDALGNRIPDYSGVGYKNGTAPIPDVPVKITLSPVAGDDAATIQAAINAVKALPLDTNGFRGAILLNAGEYQIAGNLIIDGSGIVLRGVGDGTNGTVLRATGAGQRTLIRVTGSGSASTVANTTRNITNNYVPVGARSFNVDSTSGLAVGDRVMVRRIATDQWIQDLGMDLLGPASGGDPDDVPWTTNSYQLDFDRIITRIEGNRITVDAPITCAIESKYAGGTIRKYTWSGRINNVGIENLRGVSDFNSAVTTNSPSPTYYSDEDHGWTFIQFNSVENAWVRRVTSQYFGFACVALYSGARCVTVQDCRSLDPVSIITGARRYAFVLDDAQLSLVQNCYTHKDRHQFVTQSETMGPNVFVDGWSDTAYSDAGPHHRWGTGAIWDNVTVNGNSLNVQNRGNSGTGHGWAGANEVVWNSKANSFVVQNPPTARNWLIGSVGTIQNGTMWVGPHDPGTYDSHGTNVFPNSLYYAQLQDRLAAPNLQTREYWVGEINQFAAASPTGTVVSVDAAWRSSVQAAAGAVPVNGFDLVTNSQWVPFTFSFSLAGNERIVGASLALAMRATSSGGTNAALYLDSLASSNRFTSLGWSPIGKGTNTTVRLLDLGGHLNLLTDGKLNLAVQNDVGIDWALLEIQVTTNVTAYTNTFPAAADAYVRGGTFAGDNFGTDTVLAVKLDSANVQRQAYVRWDLSGVTGQVLQARVRLTPTSVGTNGLQHGVTLSTSNTWSETSVTWNNQPGGGKRFATWIPTANVPVEFAVTPQVQAVMNGDGLLDLEVFSLSNVGGPGFVNYASREDSSATRRPQLILTLAGTAVNTAPAISTITNRTLGMDGTTGPIPFTVADAQSAPQNLSLEATSSNPTLVPQANILFSGSTTNRMVTITPAAGQTGNALVTVTVTDPGGLSTNTAFTLTVTSGSALFATNDSYSVDEDTLLVVAAPGLLANDTNTSDGTLFAVLADGPANGALSLSANGGFTYLAATNFFGVDSFTYRVTDGVSTSAVATVSLTVLPVNDPPVAANDSYSTLLNTALVVSAPGVLTNDFDPDTNALTAVLVAGPTNGLLTLNTNGGFTYQPATNYFGADSFTYVATDGAATSGVAVVTLTVTLPPPPSAVVWSGGSASNLNWSSTGNWLPVALPGTTTDVRFIDLGVASNAASSNNVVPINLAVQSLAYAQTNGYHHTLIQPGVTLTVSNNSAGILFRAGTETEVSAAQQTTNTISGAGGTLKLVGTNSSSSVIVREAHTTAGPHRATLDLSGLDTLELAVGNLAVAVQGSLIRPAGTLLLARTNTITLNGSTPALALGDGNSNGGNALLQLGRSNAVFTDDVLVSGRKSIATLQFNPEFTNDNPGLVLRGRTTSRVASFAIGDNSGTANSGVATTGTVDLSGGAVDGLVDTMYVGRSQNGGGSGAANGTLTFSAGTLDVNTLEAGYQMSNTVAAVATGTVNVNGTATLRVNSSLRLARYTGAGTTPAGNLNVNGGTLRANVISAGNPGTTTLTVTNGTLNVTNGAGTASAPIGTVRLSNARLEIPVAAGVTNLFVNTLLADSATTNRVHITSLPAITNYPAQFPLIRYASLNSFAFALGSLPGTAYAGSLSNNAVAGTVDLVITPATPPQFTGIAPGAGGSFTLSGTGPDGAGYRIFATTNLTLPFSNWTATATGIFSGGVFNFTDTQASNFPQRFYRAVTP